jgi:DNA-binding CsgD family transcriptional regulator
VTDKVRSERDTEQVDERLSTLVDWTSLIATGVVADDLTAIGIARYAEVDRGTADVALEAARAAGVLTADGRIAAESATQLVATLAPQRVATIHAAVARRMLGGGPAELRRGLRHLRRAAAVMPSAELVALADRAGGFALDVADAEVARDLLLVAVEHDASGDLAGEAVRNLQLSQALTLLGEPLEARSHLLRAIVLAEECGEPALAVRAAERFALPADWQAGDARVVGILRRVQHMPGLAEEDRIRLLATQAWVEARLPVAQLDDQQLAWIGRPGVARPLAEEALSRATSHSPATRLLALLAWRHTHRAPQFLDERREVSMEALAIAERVGTAAEQVEAAVLLAVDLLEGGDRPAHARTLTAATALAERSGDGRLQWRTLVPEAGIALMEHDLAKALALTERAFDAGTRSSAPGLLASRWLLSGQLATRHGDTEAIAAALAVDRALLTRSPLGRAGISLLLARAGAFEDASTQAWATLSHLDEESSLLLTVTRLADAAVALDDAGLAGELLPLLMPWSGRMVVDANGWWCDGPVDLWVAELLRITDGPSAPVASHLANAEHLARATGDLRSLRRIAAAGAPDGAGPTAHAADARLEALGLTGREIDVLAGLAAGATYRQLADELAYSVSTIRNDAVAIYRKLGVRGRSEAAARAVSLGLRPAPRPTRAPFVA